MLDQLHSAYMAKVDKEVCKVMAGFSKEEPYCVPRTHLKLLLYCILLKPTSNYNYQIWLIGGLKLPQ